MAPMLRRKSFALAKPLTESLKPGEEVYTIDHTNESFRDKEEYDARLQLYGKQIWTCKSTGSSKLTHKEAWDQEQKVSKLLQKKFQSCFEKPALEIIHHNRLALGQLVEDVYRRFMTRYVVDEECNYEDGNGQSMRVKIIKEFPPEKGNQEPAEKKAESTCDTSSGVKVKANEMGSDNYGTEPFKEEESGLIASQRDCLSEQALHSPPKHLISLKKEEKWALSKFLSPKYDVKLKNEDNIISSVPAKCLHRLESPPNKKIVRYFIRHYALRIGTGEDAHWGVEDELVKRYSLPSKYSDLLENPDKYMMLNSPPRTEIKKRERLSASEKKTTSNMKVKTDDEKYIKDETQKNNKLPIPQSPTLWHQKNVNENENSTSKLDSESNNCIQPEILSMQKNLKLEEINNLNSQTSSEKLKMPKKNFKNPMTNKMSLVDMSIGSSKVTDSPMTTAESQQMSRNVQKDTTSIVFHLIAYYRDNKDRKDRKTSLSSLMTKTIRLMRNDDLALLPDDLRVLVEKRREKIEHKQKLATMTEDQQKEFLSKKHNQLKEKKREKAKERRQKEIEEKAKKRQHYKDQDLSEKSLPTFMLMKTPELLPMTTAESQKMSRNVQKDTSSIVLHLIAYYRDNKDRKSSLSCLLTKAVRLMSNDDLALLPEDLRVLVEKRREKMEHKQKLASMTEDQRMEYLCEKHNRLKEKMQEKAKERRQKDIEEKVEKQKRYKDQGLLDKSLPPFKLMKTPELLQMTTAESQQMSRNVQKDASSIVLHLIEYYRDNKDRKERKSSLSSLMTKTIRWMSNDDLALLPEDLRVLVEKRREKIEHKQKLSSMTEDQRKEFLREKHNQLKQKMREKAKERRQKEIEEKAEKQQRYEDQDLLGKSLPTFKLVKTPEQLPNTAFGDVVMVVEFLSCYSQLPITDEKYSLNAVTLMEALTVGNGGFLYINRVLLTLLHILLQDEIAKGFVEMGMKVSEIPLTLHSVSEVVRLTLCNSEAEYINEQSFQGESSVVSKDIASFENYEMEDEFLPKLKISEYFDLTTEEKLNILVALCHRILSTHSVHNHLEEQQERSAKLTKVMKKVSKNIVKTKKTKDKEPKTEVTNKETEENVANTGGEENGAKINTKNQIDLDAEDVPNDVKGQSMLLKQGNMEEEQDCQMKEKIKIDAEEAQVGKENLLLENALKESIAKANLALRRTPLGTDRNHNRYWLFADVVPGLFIESGWIHESINYTCSQSTNKLIEEYDPHHGDNPRINGMTDKVDNSANSVVAETTVPKQGDNLWFVCDTQKELDQLLDCLHPQGVRESELKDSLHKRYQDIVNSISLAHKPIPELKDSDGQQELLNRLRTDVIDLARRLYKAGLGYLDETANFEARVNSIDNLKDFGDCVIALHASVGKRFLQGFMAPEQKAQSEDATLKTKYLDEEKLIEESKVLSNVEKWKGAIRNAKTFSRMHVLLGMLDVCIKWDMSSENARCKVCSRKGGDYQLILCDTCNKAFHLFCLRPALYEIPDGEWLCSACQPSTARHITRIRRYTEDSSDEEDEKKEDAACQSSTAKHHTLSRYYAEDSTEAEDESDKESSADEIDSEYVAEDNGEDEDDYPELMVQHLRSVKDTKAKQRRDPCSEFKGQSPAKKRKILTDEGCLQLAAPVNGAELYDLVEQNKGTQPHNCDLQLCQYILNQLINYRFSWPLREPSFLEEADNDMEDDKNPMDFITIMSKCTCNMYHTVHEFLEDIKVVFNNAELYNHNRDHVYTCLERTENYLVALLEKHLPAHSYERNKQKKRPAKRLAPLSDEDDSEDSTSASANHCMAKKAKVS